MKTTYIITYRTGSQRRLHTTNGGISISTYYRWLGGMHPSHYTISRRADDAERDAVGAIRGEQRLEEIVVRRAGNPIFVLTAKVIY